MVNRGILGLISIALAFVIAVIILKAITGLWPLSAIELMTEYNVTIAGVFFGGLISIGISILVILAMTALSWIIGNLLEKLFITNKNFKT